MKRIACAILILALLLTTLCGCEPTDKNTDAADNSETSQGTDSGAQDTQSGNKDDGNIGSEPETDGPELGYSDFDEESQTKPTGTGTSTGTTSPQKKPQTQTNTQTNPNGTTQTPSTGGQDKEDDKADPAPGAPSTGAPSTDTPSTDTPGQTDPAEPSEPVTPTDPPKDDKFEGDGYYSEVVKP